MPGVYPARVLRLASSSPRRIDLLRLLQVPFEPFAPNVDEARFASPARAKADAVERGDATIAADTEILFDGERFGKPTDESHAIAMLASLSGNEHEVRTHVVVVAAGGARLEFDVRSRVTLRELTMRQIERYVGTGEPLDRAGAYAIQRGTRLSNRRGMLREHHRLPLCHVTSPCPSVSGRDGTRRVPDALRVRGRVAAGTEGLAA